MGHMDNVVGGVAASKAARDGVREHAVSQSLGSLAASGPATLACETIPGGI